MPHRQLLWLKPCWFGPAGAASSHSRCELSGARLAPASSSSSWHGEDRSEVGGLRSCAHAEAGTEQSGWVAMDRQEMEPRTLWGKQKLLQSSAAAIQKELLGVHRR